MILLSYDKSGYRDKSGHRDRTGHRDKRGHHDKKAALLKIRRRAGLLLFIVIKVDHDKSEHRVRVTCIE